MQLEQKLGYQPLVSIIVPITNDAHESAKRLDCARSQTWRRIEVIPVQAQGVNGIAQAVNKGLSTSKGDFISLLLPDVIYAHNKTARQVAFVKKFDLQEAVVFL